MHEVLKIFHRIEASDDGLSSISYEVLIVTVIGEAIKEFPDCQGNTNFEPFLSNPDFLYALVSPNVVRMS